MEKNSSHEILIFINLSLMMPFRTKRCSEQAEGISKVLVRSGYSVRAVSVDDKFFYS